MSQKKPSLDEDPFLYTASLLKAICHALTTEQRARIAAELMADAHDMNDAAESADDQQFALALASLAALAEDGPDAAFNVLDAIQPR
ncbi:MAG: hypothetical protein EPN70_00720 [Paraburkholderia sp.]|uniref:hypothetical protein n=1 Tax=Paraburkholderia sp. TaxID=1926495 RepID=UPI0012247596|nr:hypothetical protein [Paraburkholderia sp.]TAM08297.1 MAG: hypothetical protein EPN70_00720 [Paraburkholderia sp.]TAM28049.1 MAG: hypothetical protein EPN59_17925 [Paraburkholderia sp.]